MSDLLIYADTERAAELRHEIPHAIVDPFLYAERDGRSYIVISELDGEQAAKARPDAELLSSTALGRDELMASGLNREEVAMEVVLRACRKLGIDRADVPPAFPLALADHLRAGGVELVVARELFETRRRVKSGAELDGIRRAQRAADAGMAAGAELILSAGEGVTCEAIKAAMEAAVREHGCDADEFIVARGGQGALGHELGSGPIAAGEPVIIDHWPRDRATGCFSDMTRTFVIGEPDDELVEWHGLCLHALRESTAAVRPGVTGRELFDLVCQIFEDAGQPTLRTKAHGESLRDGFFHSLGHGVGLEIHEAPDLGRTGDAPLVPGDVIAIEPGLYRQGYGGVRLEDLVLVTEDGHEVLTDFGYDL